MNESKSVLVVVDVQNGLVTEHSEPIVPIIADLVSRWHAACGDDRDSVRPRSVKSHQSDQHR